MYEEGDLILYEDDNDRIMKEIRSVSDNFKNMDCNECNLGSEIP